MIFSKLYKIHIEIETASYIWRVVFMSISYKLHNTDIALSVDISELGFYLLNGRASYLKSREVLNPRDSCLDLPIVLKPYKYLGSSAAEVTVKFQGDAINITSKLVASRLQEISLYDIRPLCE